MAIEVTEVTEVDEAAVADATVAATASAVKAVLIAARGAVKRVARAAAMVVAKAAASVRNATSARLATTRRAPKLSTPVVVTNVVRETSAKVVARRGLSRAAKAAVARAPSANRAVRI